MSSFNILNGSDDDSDDIGDDFEAKPTTNNLFRQRSRNPAWEPAESNNTINNRNKNNINDDIEATKFRRQQQDNDPIPMSFSNGTKNQSSSRRKENSSRKMKQGDEFNMNDIAEQLPKHLRTNLSQMSSTVRLILLLVLIKEKSQASF